MTNRLFCFGLGFSAAALARRLAPKGWRIAGTARSRERVQALGDLGYEGFAFAGPLANPADTLRDTTHILLSVPPGPDGDPVLKHHVHDLSALIPRIKWVGYLSTTGVYGDHQGDWVDEQTPANPASERGKRRLVAEHAWAAWGTAMSVPVQVFRLAGIYGPERNQLASLRDGTARRIVKQGQVFSRIHVNDIAQVLEASIARPRPGAIYNVCDDEPAPPHEVIEYAAKLLNRAAPPLERFEDAARSMSEMALSFYAESKRVRNDLIKRELGVALTYSTYREGLRALLKA
ncbi:MAG: SDR family oxidoreductase [Alphaproteobacteria bacterium]|nr:SDR family oxidoreductase [Alphaproteobacteria bacterium]